MLSPPPACRSSPLRAGSRGRTRRTICVRATCGRSWRRRSASTSSKPSRPTLKVRGGMWAAAGAACCCHGRLLLALAPVPEVGAGLNSGYRQSLPALHSSSFVFTPTPCTLGPEEREDDLRLLESAAAAAGDGGGGAAPRTLVPKAVDADDEDDADDSDSSDSDDEVCLCVVLGAWRDWGGSQPAAAMATTRCAAAGWLRLLGCRMAEVHVPSGSRLWITDLC